MYFPRKKLDYLHNLIQKESAVILIGSRQVGKTTLMQKMEQDLRDSGEKTFYFSLELPSNLEIFSSGPEGVLEYFKAQGVDFEGPSELGQIFIFLDEFQYIPNAGKLLKALIDNFPAIKIIASGSSSVEIQKSMKESLVGRKRIVNIYPLDFSEFLLFKDAKEADYFPDINVERPLQRNTINLFKKLFSEFVLWGGMPRIVLEQDQNEKREMLEEICSSYLQKDVKGLIGTENVAAFNKLMRLIARETGTILSVHSLANTLNMARSELEDALFILENTYVNFLIRPFFTNKRKELSKAPKTVFYDNGIRNSLINNMAPVDGRTDKGFMFETAVFNELEKSAPSGMQIQYWRTQHQTEVDFVLRYDQHKIPVEVKAGTTKNAPRALVSFAESYGSKCAFVLNQDNWEIKEINDTKVYFLPHFCAGFLPKKIQSG